MTILYITVPKGSELGGGRKRAVLTDDVTVDIVLDEPAVRSLAYRAILNKSSKAKSGVIVAKVRRG